MDNIWDANRGKVITSKGGWVIGKSVALHGHSLLEALVGEVSYFQILVLNATGKMVTPQIAAYVEALYGCMSWPDPRIWCNQIGALGGTMRSSVFAAVFAGNLGAESRAYGAYTCKLCMQTILRFMEQKKQGMSLEEIVEREIERLGGKPTIMGFARPIAKGDERIATLERVYKKQEIPRGKYLTLAFEIETLLFEKYGETMNIAGHIAASMCDFDINETEMMNVLALIVNSGITACYVDASERPEKSFMPLRCDDIVYEGKESRNLSSAKMHSF